MCVCRGGLYEGGYTWSNTSVKGKVSLFVGGLIRVVGGL